jgi:hypothetical protein
MKIFENFLSNEELISVSEVLKLPRWEYGFISTDKDKPIWNFDKGSGKEIVNLLIPKLVDYELLDYHINGQTTLQDSSVHQDHWNGCTHTIVFFPNDWNYTWGGRLHIFDGNKTHIITPQKNLAVMFESKLKHYAEAPSVKTLRVSISLKLIKKIR